MDVSELHQKRGFFSEPITACCIAMEKGGIAMDPFDKTQTDPIWQRVWNRQPLAPPPQPASPGPGRPVPPPPPEQLARPAPPPAPLQPHPGMSWTPQELLRQSREEGAFGRQCQMLGRSLGPGGRTAMNRLHHQAMERSACLRGMARPGAGRAYDATAGTPPGARWSERYCVC